MTKQLRWKTTPARPTSEFSFWRPVSYSDTNITQLIAGITILKDLCYEGDCHFYTEDPRLVYLNPTDYQSLQARVPGTKHLNRLFRDVIEQYNDHETTPPTNIQTAHFDPRYNRQDGSLDIYAPVDPEALPDYNKLFGAFRQYLNTESHLGLKSPRILIGRIGSLSMEHSAPGVVNEAVEAISIGEITTGPLVYTMMPS